MNLEVGNQLGPYAILEPLGTDGTGQSYRARDTRLDRLLVLKVLPGDLTGELLARRLLEARAVAALNHPHLLGIKDCASHGDLQYVVTDLLEGESLRTRLARGVLAPRKGVELALQIAQGLAAAHAQGVAHRGLAPSELWITREGKIKILDFGLFGPQGAGTLEAGEGLAYLSPEQVRGEEGGPKGDLFSLGAVLFEMLTGREAFRRPTPEGTLAAILQEEPPATEDRPLPPVLKKILEHCLEKDPGARFRDAQGLAFALDSLPASLGLPTVTAPLEPVNRRTTLTWAALVACLVLAAGFTGWHFHRQGLVPATCHLLNFPVGTIESARFGADGRTIYCSLRLAGAPPEIFALDPGSLEPRALGLRDALLLGVSPSDELALIRAPKHIGAFMTYGALNLVQSGGGVGRAGPDLVLEAIWDGTGWSTTSSEDLIQGRLEFPARKVAATWDLATRNLTHLALSGDGKLLACADADYLEAVTSLVVFRRQGGRRVLYTREGDGTGGAFTGLAWGPGRELWVSEVDGDETIVWALSLQGEQRILWRSPGNLQLLDVSRDGRALMVHQASRSIVCAMKAGESSLLDLSIQGQTQLRGISASGQVLLDESPVVDGGTILDRCFLRPVAGGPLQALGKGFALTLTGGGGWVQVDPGPLPARDMDPAWAQALAKADQAMASELEDPEARSRLLLFVPTGPGTPFALAVPKGYEPTFNPCYLLPGGQRVLTSLLLGDNQVWVLLDRRGGPPVQVTPPGEDWLVVGGLEPVSPDGTRFLGSRDAKAWFIVPMSGGQPVPIQGIRSGERLMGWSADGNSVFVRSGPNQVPVVVARMDLKTGARRPVTSFKPLDPTGFLSCRDAYLTPDGAYSVFSYQAKISDLYLLENLAGGR